MCSAFSDDGFLGTIIRGYRYPRCRVGLVASIVHPVRNHGNFYSQGEADRLPLPRYDGAMKDTPEMRGEILELVASGLSRDDACEAAGIHRSSLYRWLEYETFATQLTQAERRNKLRCMTLVQAAGKTNWKAAAWWLERKYPEEFSTSRTTYPSINSDLLTILAGAPKENRTNLIAYGPD